MALKNEYYSAAALSSTGIKKINQSPAHFVAWKNALHKPGKALIIGELLHYLTLTPELVEGEVAVFTKGKSLDSKKGSEFVADNPGKFVCTLDQWEFAEKVAEKLFQDSNIVRLLNRPNVRNEHEIYTSIDGVRCKALVDSICPSIILDVKSSSDSGAYFKKSEEFKGKFFKLGYDIQGAWYQKLAELQDGIVRDVLFLVLELEDPYATRIVQPSQEVLDVAWEKCYQAVQVYAQCIDTGLWPSYPFDIEMIELPGWSKKRQK